jgi:hypothetical protein
MGRSCEKALFISFGNNFFKKHSINVDTYTCIIIHLYKYMHVYPTSMSTSERLSQIDLEINEIGRQERLAVDGDVGSH